MPNELTVGAARTGHLIDFDPDTPELPARLERSSSRLMATISWSSPEDPYAAWFVDTDGMPLSPAGRTKRMPGRILFCDSHGSLLLVGCQARGFHGALFGPGNGTLWGRAAIVDVHQDVEFDRPHGLQTEISGLRDWLGVTSWETRIEARGSVTLVNRTLPPVRVGEFAGLELELRPGWMVEPDSAMDRVVAMDLLRCVTTSSSPASWDSHLQLHRAVRDLLVISRWHRESLVEVLIQRADDPLLTADGKSHGRQWRTVIVPDAERSAPPSGYRQHLIRYDELGATGLLRWLAVRESFARALDPVTSSIGLLQGSANTLLAHTGPGLEALGYLLLVRDGDSERRASGTPLRARLERVLRDLDGCLPFDGPKWADDMARVYNGLKHANRDTPDELDVLNAWRKSVLAVRAWVAVELGVAPAVVSERLATDPQRHEYVRTTDS